MKEIGVRSDGNSEIGGDLLDFDRFVEVDDIFSFMGKFDKNSVFAHDFDNFADIGIDLLEGMELFFEARDYDRSGDYHWS